MKNIRLIVTALVASILLAYGAVRWLEHQESAKHIQEANHLDISQANHGTQEMTHEQEAKALTPVIHADEAQDQDDDAAVARDRATVGRLRAVHPGPDPAPAPRKDDPQPISPPLVMAPLDAAKDKLIDDLTKDLDDTKKSLADTQAQANALATANLERQAQVKDLQGEVAQLRAAIASRPSDLHWALSGIYGSSQTIGAGLEYDVSVVRVGIDVVRHQLPNGQDTLEAVGRLGVKF